MVSNGIIKKITKTTIIIITTITALALQQQKTTWARYFDEEQMKNWGTAPYHAVFKYSPMTLGVSWGEMASAKVKLTNRKGETCNYIIYNHILEAYKRKCKESKKAIAIYNGAYGGVLLKLEKGFTARTLTCTPRPYGIHHYENTCVVTCRAAAYLQREWEGMKNIKDKEGRYKIKFPKIKPKPWFPRLIYHEVRHYTFSTTYVHIHEKTIDEYDKSRHPTTKKYGLRFFSSGYPVFRTQDPPDCDEIECAKMKNIKRRTWETKDIIPTLKKIISKKLGIKPKYKNTEKTIQQIADGAPDKAECGKINIFGREYNDCMAAGLLKVMKYPIIIKLLMMTFKKI